tara:strand:- start:1237 stop:1968 length:732 start_codon:yes stop_codon:yes gene_type:complete
MSITIKKHKKPCLKPCEMVCDKPLHKKLNNFELTKFMNSHTTNLLIGKPRSGKTSLLFSLFENKDILKKVYHRIYIFQPPQSRQSMKNKLFDKLPADQLFEELSFENLDLVLDEIKATSDLNIAIIFDDVSASLKNFDTLNLMKQLIFNRRHLRTSVFFLVQTWFSVPKDIRKLFSNIFVFRVNKNELKTIFDETIEDPELNVLAPNISKLVYDKPYNFMFINTDTQRIFKNFDELIFAHNNF